MVIEAFGTNRCMFESNFSVDRFGCDYVALWNAFKRLAAHYSTAEKAALFGGTATRVYRLRIDKAEAHALADQTAWRDVVRGRRQEHRALRRERVEPCFDSLAGSTHMGPSVTTM
jgi:amidohydrolase family protein